MNATPPDPALEARVALQQVLAEARRGRRALTLRVGAVLLVVIFCLWFTDFLNGERLAEGVPALGVMFSEMIPPDFRRWQQWIRPMLDTVAMSIAGTALAIVMSVPIAFLAARNTTPGPVTYHIARTVLNALRAIPELIMGIVRGCGRLWNATRRSCTGFAFCRHGREVLCRGYRTRSPGTH